MLLDTVKSSAAVPWVASRGKNASAGRRPDAPTPILASVCVYGSELPSLSPDACVPWRHNQQNIPDMITSMSDRAIPMAWSTQSMVPIHVHDITTKKQIVSIDCTGERKPRD
eukprot:3661495-Amphidinium_carterae.1